MPLSTRGRGVAVAVSGILIFDSRVAQASAADIQENYLKRAYSIVAGSGRRL
jgi:hypothetical protein